MASSTKSKAVDADSHVKRMVHLFENVEFKEPPQTASEQPAHPFVVDNRKRKRDAEADDAPITKDTSPSTNPPPSKKARTDTQQHPGYNASNPHQRRSRPSNYYQKRLKHNKSYHLQLHDMESHVLSKIARSNWLNPDGFEFDPALVDRLYYEFISDPSDDARRNRTILEYSHYLEEYLWRFFDPKKSSNAHVLSMMYFINEQFNQQISVWDILIDSKYHPSSTGSGKDNRSSNASKLSSFFQRIFELKLNELDSFFIVHSNPDNDDDRNNNNNNNNITDNGWNMNERTNFIVFLIHCFHKMEMESVRIPVIKLIGLPLFEYLNPKQRQKIFTFVPPFEKSWNKFIKNKGKIARFQRELYHLLIKELFYILKSTETLHKVLHESNDSNHSNRGHSSGSSNLQSLEMEYQSNLQYIYRFTELIVDNLSLLMTRRYLRQYLESSNILFLIRCKYLVSPTLYADDAFYHSMVDRIDFYLHFAIDDFDGRSLTDHEVRLEQYHKFVVLQKCAFKYFYGSLKEMALATISSLDHRVKLQKFLSVLDLSELHQLAVKLHILPDDGDGANDLKSLLRSNDLVTNYTEKELVIEILVHHHLSRPSKREQIANLPLYPTESVLFDDANVADRDAVVLALDKLNLQFLSIYDYLLRNFTLFRLETAHSIRDDIAKCIWKIRPRLRRNPNTKIRDTIFSGYSRMAVPIDEFAITAVKPPKLGESKPAKVTAEICIDLKPFHDEVLSEWKDLRAKDVLFLVRLHGTHDEELPFDQYLNDLRGLNPKLNEFGVGHKTWDKLSREELGIEFVRGCQVVQVRDGDDPDKVIGERDLETREEYKAEGTKRIFDVELDTAQYQLDIAAMVEQQGNGSQSGAGRDVYTYFNVLIRRRGKENNFKSVLQTISSLMAHSNDAHVWSDREKKNNGNGNGIISQSPSSDIHLLPSWFERLFLGYDDPRNSSYYHIHKSMAPPPDISSDKTMGRQSTIQKIEGFYCLDFKDAFLDQQHVVKSFPGFKIKWIQNGKITDKVDGEKGTLHRIWFSKTMKEPNRDLILRASLHGDDDGSLDVEQGSEGEIMVEPYKSEEVLSLDGRGEHVDDPKINTVRYTPIQIEAIKSGMHYGLTMVVGPPGSGKTDVAVQIIRNLYGNFGCTERILLVTHSNMALNDLFAKLTERDIDQRHLLRLGFGHKDLDRDFSVRGRIDHMLQDRADKLQIAQSLAISIGLPEDSGYCHTAETCAHFKNEVLMNHWRTFEDALDELENEFTDVLDSKIGEMESLFPFKTFVVEQRHKMDYGPSSLSSSSNNDDDGNGNGGMRLFDHGQSYSFNKSMAYKYWRSILGIFEDLRQCHPFELLRTHRDRSQYLLSRQSVLVAMTCSLAAIERDEFLSLSFEYDTLIMEEAAQVLDVESFIPMVLQNASVRLKRVVLIGDHYQLPPMIKRRNFAEFTKFDQSLFTRLIRLGTPFHLLNMQGRCRPSLRRLWSWRYQRGYQMGDLQCVQRGMYHFANSGFRHEYQLIAVNPFLGKGEFEPNPYFYQNLDEAEWVVNCFMLMRLMGYPKETITILTTYNGQKVLIQEILDKKCRNDPLFGIPELSTVDRYQGSQNEYVLLSLVRTRSVGHIRDVRRLIVALSRSRLGLYVFANVALLRQCYQLKPVFDILLQRPSQLILVTNESYPTRRTLKEKVNIESLVKVEGVSHLMHIVNSMVNAVRGHLKAEYESKMEDYQQRATAALQEWRRKKAQQQSKEVINVDDDDDDDDGEDDGKRGDNHHDVDGKEETEGKEEALDNKEKFDLAAQMALMRSNQTMDDDDDDVDLGNDDADESSSEAQEQGDEQIEYESSSSDSDES